MGVLPPREKEGKRVNTGVSLPEDLLRRLDEVAELENYSRNEVVMHFLRWALVEYEKEKRSKK